MQLLSRKRNHRDIRETCTTKYITLEAKLKIRKITQGRERVTDTEEKKLYASRNHTLLFCRVAQSLIAFKVWA